MASAELEPERIAIVGIAGRFPGAPTIGAFWERLCRGEECLTRFSAADLRATGVPDAVLNDPRYVPVNGVITDVDRFDAEFFGLNPREASITDPQHRVFLELAWHALEDAGHDPARATGSIGVYAGCGPSSYLLQNLWPCRDDLADVGDLRVRMANGQEYLATRVSYKLNLTGPSVNVNTACSTSLVAVHMACEALLNFQCDLALAGGISIQLPQEKGYLYEDGGILSPDGHCRAFDAAAQGTVSGNGGAVVVLKRLSAAVADRNNIYAVIRGSAVNNDGSAKASYTAPSLTGQAHVIAEAQAMSGIPAEAIGCIETHGTGTPVGDPIEFAALTKAFRAHTDRVHFCAIGSVKTNVGHLDEAAGVTGLIKMALSLYHRQMPPSLHFRTPNPELAYDASPFYVNAELAPWSAPRGGGLRAAAVSSFGIGGTNAHVILEDAPQHEHERSGRPIQLLTCSARDPVALVRHAHALGAALGEHAVMDLSDVAWTLQEGRRAFPCRHFVVAASAAEARVALERAHPAVARQAPADAPPVVFMFSGQGSQHPGMTRSVYASEPVFRTAIDTCADLLRPALGRDLRRLLYPESLDEERTAGDLLTRTEFAQPALFAVEHALVLLWRHWGVQPAASIGHSVGEYVAAWMAGVMDLDTALAIVAARGRVMQSAATGSMLAVPMSARSVEAFLADGVEIAAINAPDQCVIAGPTDAIEQCAARLASAGVESRVLRVSHAFHSTAMDSILDSFETELRRHVLQPPRLPWISNLSGRWIAPEQAIDPAYYVAHLRRPVQFAAGLSQVLRDHPRAVLVEVGPGQSLMRLSRQCVPATAVCVASCSATGDREGDDLRALLTSVGELWARGVPVDWKAFAGPGRRRVSLPGYPFERKRFWIAPAAPAEPDAKLPASTRTADPDSWVYAPSWKRIESHGAGARDHEPTANPWVCFVDDGGVGAALSEELRRHGGEVTTVHAGRAFARTGPHSYTVRPGDPIDFDALIRDLEQAGARPRSIVHLWCLDDADSLSAANDRGFYSLVALVQALVRRGSPDGLAITIVSSGLHEVTGEETLDPAKATVLGPVRVIPQEFPGVSCRNIDVSRTTPCLEHLLDELLAPSADRIVALRGKYRWTETFDRLERANAVTRLRPRGVYLITGGLGNLGLILSEYLGASKRARLVLTGRSPFPRKEDWNGWLAAHDDSDSVSRTIRRLQNIETLGATVLTLEADVTSDHAMEAAVSAAEALFGPIDGVFHAAGVPGRRSFVGVEELERATCEEHFDVKARGLMVLEKVFHDRPPDFFFLFSSLASVLGGLGFAAYSAANHFLDAAARAHAGEQRPEWLGVNWDGWQVGPAVNDASVITPEEGTRLIERILEGPRCSQVVVSTGDLQARRARWVATRPAVAHARQAPDVMRPGDPLQENLASVWKETLGVDGIGPDDDFFAVHGDSLLATQLIARVNRVFGARLTLRDFFERPTLSAMVDKLKVSGPGPAKTIDAAPLSADYPVTHAQKRLWILAQNPEASIAYNMCYALRLTGALDVDALRRAFQSIVERHEILRTAFVTVQAEPRQRIQPAASFELAVVDLGPARDLPDAIDSEAGRESVRSFQLDRPPLVRARVLRTAEQEHVLLVSLHHIVADALTLNVLMRELHVCYSAYCEQRSPELPELSMQFKDFAVWQQRQLSGDAMRACREYWLGKLSDDVAALELPTDRPWPQEPQFGGGQVVSRLPLPEHERLQQVCQSHGITLFTLLLAATKVVLHQMTGQADIVVGTPVAGRSLPELDGQIGYYLNNVVLRDTVRRSEPFAVLLQRVRATVAEALANQEYPFDRLVEELGLPVVPGRSPLFDVQVNLMPAETPALQLGGLQVSTVPGSTRTTMFALNFMFSESAAGLALELGYARPLFEPVTIERLGARLIGLLRTIGLQPESTVRALCDSLAEGAADVEKARFLSAALNLNDTF